MSDIETWLRELSLGKYVLAFAEAEIELTDLVHLLDDDDLKDIGAPGRATPPRNRGHQAPVSQSRYTCRRGAGQTSQLT